MICDLHVHTYGVHPGNFVSRALLQRLGFRLFSSRFGLPWRLNDEVGTFEKVEHKTLCWLAESSVEQAVILALDAPYLINGEIDEANIRIVVSNDYIADLSDAHDKVLFGASIHPYRKDAIKELERVIKRGACLIKWLPGAQNIEPDHHCCFEFYDALAHYEVPLLCHTGSEHVLKVYSDNFNDPCRLIPALERGVTVIAAHCGTRILPNERSFFSSWKRMALNYERFYGDLAAFITFCRLAPLRQMLNNSTLLSKLVFGSDFPALHFPLQYLPRIGLSKAFKLQFEDNPFDQAILTLQAVGVPEEVFSRGFSLLRL